MTRPANVKMYQAQDGSLHQTGEAAASHDAYARLIAAAPDMLAALVTLVHDIDSSTPVELRTLPKWEAARAAVAKATGGQS